MLKYLSKSAVGRFLARQRFVFFWLGWILAAVALLILARETAIHIAVLTGISLVLFVVMMLEIFTRRQWEHHINSRFEDHTREYGRLVREIARNRMEISQLKQGLADTGRLAQESVPPRGQQSIEERMLGNIASQLSALGNMARPEGNGMLSETETSDSHSDGTDAGLVPPLSAVSPISNTTPVNDEDILPLLKRAVESDSVEIFLQPVVNLPQRKLHYYEMLSRLRFENGEYIPARRYIDLAMRENLLSAIDNLLLLRGLQLIRDMGHSEGREKAYFCNISPLTLSDAKFMSDLVEFISQNGHLAPRLIFELSQKDFEDETAMTPEIFEVLNGLSRLGCRFSVDGIRDLPIDIEFLKSRHIGYVKVEGRILLENMEKRAGFRQMKRMKAQMDAAGIDMIATHIETEKDLIELLDLEMDYGQGFLFGRPENSQKIQ